MTSVPAYILGGSGFAAGELLRLLYSHTGIHVAGIVSASSANKTVAEIHPHLAPAYPDTTTTSWDAIQVDASGQQPIAIFSALPHGLSGGKLMQVIEMFPEPERLKVVDLSADFRYPTVELFESVYSVDHPAPGAVSQFKCDLPELSNGVTSTRIAHPGCFTTSVVLGTTPLISMGIHHHVRVSAVTGSTGSGREPTPTTHHPVRANNTFAYKPLVHRHTKEMELLISKATGTDVTVSFAPQSGAFARGIYATIFADNTGGYSQANLLDAFTDYYKTAPFITVSEMPPRLKDVVGTNRCHLSVAADDDTIVVFSAIDNLIKGASGGAIQWMNRMLGYDEKMGLDNPGLGWL